MLVIAASSSPIVTNCSLLNYSIFLSSRCHSAITVYIDFRQIEKTAVEVLAASFHIKAIVAAIYDNIIAKILNQETGHVLPERNP